MRVSSLGASERPVSLLGLLPEQGETRRRLREWMAADPMIAMGRASGGEVDELVAVASALNDPPAGRVVFVDRWAAWKAAG